MGILNVQEALVLLAALAGAAHVLAPDHWLPASLLAWQRRWSFTKLSSFSLLAYVLHVAFGFFIFFFGIRFFRGVPASDLFAFSLILIVTIMIFRALRFSKIIEVQRTSPRNVWALLSVFSLLGPAESVIPILIKADQLGLGYALPLLAFLAGTVVTGTLAMLLGRAAWNRPFWLPRGLEMAHRKMAAFPVVILVAIGISFLAKISG